MARAKQTALATCGPVIVRRMTQNSCKREDRLAGLHRDRTNARARSAEPNLTVVRSIGGSSADRDECSGSRHPTEPGHCPRCRQEQRAGRMLGLAPPNRTLPLSEVTAGTVRTGRRLTAPPPNRTLPLSAVSAGAVRTGRRLTPPPPSQTLPASFALAGRASDFRWSFRFVLLHDPLQQLMRCHHWHQRSHARTSHGDQS